MMRLDQEPWTKNSFVKILNDNLLRKGDRPYRLWREAEASAMVIVKNGGVLENEEIVEGTMIQRYWIGIE